jgi:hypothetical protein
MVQRLDETQPYGNIGGNYQPPGFDRPAVYQQAGRFFDLKGRLIEPNVPLDPQEADQELAAERAEAEAKALAAEDAERLALRKALADRRAKEREKAAENRAKASLSRITPPHEAPELDRAAHYQLGEKWLDEHGREIVPGQAMTAETLTALRAQEAEAEGLPITELIAQATTMPFNVFKAAAEAILGRTCPKCRDQMVAQLRLQARKHPNIRVPRIKPAG